MRMFSFFTPRRWKCSAVERAEAPAPLNTTRTSWTDRSVISSALRRAAPAMMAVPCWSSWNTGMSSRSLSARSMIKQSGAEISSRLIPPTVGSRSSQNLMTSSAFSDPTSRSKTSMSAKALNSTPLPSITGLEARGPMLPRPSTAVPLETTATRLPRAVYLKTSSGVSAICRQGSATPGEYASDKSCAVTTDLVGTTAILPGRPSSWYLSAFLRRSAVIFLGL